MNSILEIDKALRNFGGFVRYYDTTEPLEQLVGLIPERCHHIVACCGGGDQALTLLGAGKDIRDLWAVDINPAQLFILAAKAQAISEGSVPSFSDIQKKYPQKVSPVKKDIRALNYLYAFPSGKRIIAPAEIAKKYAVIHDDGLFILPQSGPFWQNDPAFVSAVRSKAASLRFLKQDILDIADSFKPESLDLIYFSDIYWQGVTEYHLNKMEMLAGLLRPNGKIIGYDDVGEKFSGDGVSPAEIFRQKAEVWSLQVQKHSSGYIVIQKKS